MNYYVYILTNHYQGALYTGVTSDLPARIYQHKKKFVSGFSSKHELTRLVYYEHFSDINEAILREKRIKKWNCQWKIRLIDEFNPNWNDLYDSIL